MAKAAGDKKLRVGIIGAGGIAGTHAKSYKAFADVDLVAACDVKEENLQKLLKTHEIPQGFATWKEMLERRELDAVSVCTPNFLHMQPAIDALNAGCHVLCEKPLAMNAAEGQKMLAAAKKNKKHLVIGFQYRFDGNTQALRKAVRDGFFGKILYVRIQALRRRGIPSWGVFGRKDLQGGGPLIDIGVHALEMAHYTIGSPEPLSASGQIWTYLGNKPPAAACAWGKWDHKTYTVEDFAVGMLRMKTGAVIQIEASFAAHIEKDLWNFQILGEKGGANWETAQLYHDEAGLMLNSTPAHVPKVEIFPAKMRHFVDVCLYNRSCEAPAEHGLMVQKMLDGIYASAEAGQEVRIK